MIKNWGLFLALLFPEIVFSQVDSVSRSTTNILFGAGAASYAKPNEKVHVLKINFLDPIFGKYALYYERQLSESISVEVGLGITGRNYFGNVFNEILYDNSPQESPVFSDETDIHDDDYDFQSRNSNIGLFASLMPRYYFQDGFSCEGGYMGINLQYVRFNNVAYGINQIAANSGMLSYENNGQNINETESNMNLSAVFGTQLVSDKFVFDFYGSTGLKIYSAKKRDIGSVYVPDFMFVMSGQTRNVKRFAFYVEAGIKFGFWWE